MKTLRLFFGISQILLVSIQASLYGMTDTAIITVNHSQIINPASKRLLGISFEGRTSMMSGPSGTIPAGYYDPSTGLPYPGVVSLWNRIPLTCVRYPGNSVNQGVNWKYTIGPVESRTVHQLQQGAPPQRVVFGFDEFMKMTEDRGLDVDYVQIMVWIYPTATEPDPVGSAADFVEYANAPNDSSNPRGGIDWAAVRASNGRHEPYNIKMWNIGNEPWATGELNFNVTKYIDTAEAIIDAMLEVDSTLRITLPAVGNGSSPWNQGLLTSARLKGKFYALSPHYFPDELPSTPNPTVAQLQVALKNLADTTKARGVKLIIGDHARGIQTPPTESPDRAMQWRGALVTADFLLMASQVHNVDLANFWIYGMPAAVYHPIRRNADGSYTMLAVAGLYEAFAPIFHDHSLLTSTSSSSGGTPGSVRAAAFLSEDGLKASVIVVNIDTLVGHLASLPQLPGLSLSNARILRAENLNDDMFTTSPAVQVSEGFYSLPPASVLVFEFEPPLISISFDVADRWNMVSVPVDAQDYTKSVLFTTAVSEAFAYTEGYEVRTMLEGGAGYWLRFNGDQQIKHVGLHRSDDTINVVTGWNLIGSISDPVSTASIISVPPGMITSQFFGYNGGYSTSSSIEPGKAYWVKVDQAGSLILSSSGNSSMANRIQIVSTSELPPFPPDAGRLIHNLDPTSPSLGQNYPNPFNPSTVIRYGVPEEVHVTLAIYNLLGEEITRLVDGVKKAGYHEVLWSTDRVSSGIYFYRLRAGTYSETRKLVLSR